jgi:hypothetical protein
MKGGRVGHVEQTGAGEVSTFAYAGARHPGEWEAVANLEHKLGPGEHTLDNRRVELTGGRLLGVATARETTMDGMREHTQQRFLGFGLSRTRVWRGDDLVEDRRSFSFLGKRLGGRGEAGAVRLHAEVDSSRPAHALDAVRVRLRLADGREVIKTAREIIQTRDADFIDAGRALVERSLEQHVGRKLAGESGLDLEVEDLRIALGELGQALDR